MEILDIRKEIEKILDDHYPEEGGLKNYSIAVKIDEFIKVEILDRLTIKKD